nr:MerR family transcriptional regulator [uncultured Acetatifactor sp.]
MGNYLLISDAAKEVKVESHVLRYWEEELHLPIKRNELGHRYYTEEDVERFKQIKGMKERGLQLKAIKMILKDGKLDVLPPDSVQESAAEDQIREEADYRTDMAERTGGLAIDIVPNKSREPEAMQESREDKSRRLQWLLQQLIRQTLQENNKDLTREIRESVVKELDYQFRMQEEREEARDRMLAERDEEHFKKMDELLRKKSRTRKAKQEKDSDKKNQEKPENEQPGTEGKKKRRFLL